MKHVRMCEREINDRDRRVEEGRESEIMIEVYSNREGGEEKGEERQQLKSREKKNNGMGRGGNKEIHGGKMR